MFSNNFESKIIEQIEYLRNAITKDSTGYNRFQDITSTIIRFFQKMETAIPNAIERGIQHSINTQKNDKKQKVYDEVYIRMMSSGADLWKARQIAKLAADNYEEYTKKNLAMTDDEK